MAVVHLDRADGPLDECLPDLLEGLSGRLGVAALTVLYLNPVQFRAAGQVRE